MSQHGCPERLSNRSKGFQDDGPSQSTMEVLVETLTGTAFEMTVLPTDTIFAIKSKIFRVEGIPVSQQHLLYNLVELDDSSSLREHAISDGARLRLVLGMRGGPISTRRLPPPSNAEPWRDIERLLDTNRDDGEWGSSGCKVTVLVFRDGERVNMMRVKENHDGTYSPLDHNKYSSTSSSLSQLVGCEGASVPDTGAGSLHDNVVTMTKMMELRRRMESLSVQRGPPRTDDRSDKVEIQKTRSEETLSVPSLLDLSANTLKQRAGSYAPLADDDTFMPLYDGNYTRYDYDCSFTDRYTLLPPIGTRADSDQSVGEAGADSDRRQLSDTLAGSILLQGRRDAADDAAILEEVLDSDQCVRQDSPQLPENLAPVQAEYGPLVCGSSRSWVSLGGGGGGGGGVQARGGAHSHSASSLHVRAPPPRRAAPLSDALFSSSTSDLEKLKRNSRILPALSRHRPREHLHLSDERLDAPRALRREPPPDPAPPPAPHTAAPAPATETPASAPPTDTPETPAPAPPTETPETPAPAPPTESPEIPAAPARRSRPRCAWCRKRLSIATLHRCRCGACYCAPHRYAEVHGCLYDYRAAAAALLARELPAVVAPKLPRI